RTHGLDVVATNVGLDGVGELEAILRCEGVAGVDMPPRGAEVVDSVHTLELVAFNPRAPCPARELHGGARGHDEVAGADTSHTREGHPISPGEMTTLDMYTLLGERHRHRRVGSSRNGMSHA